MTRQARFSIAVDEEVALDGNLTSSRSPKDLPAVCAVIVEQFVDFHRCSVFRTYGSAESSDAERSGPANISIATSGSR
jgi:hypothetical protein